MGGLCRSSLCGGFFRRAPSYRSRCTTRLVGVVAIIAILGGQQVMHRVEKRVPPPVP